MSYGIENEAEPDLVDIFSDLKKSIRASISVAEPAKILKYNGDQTVDVQPLINGRYKNESVIKPPATHLPIIYPAGSGYRFWIEPQVGDRCVIVSVNGSLEEFISGANKPYSPKMLKKFGHCDRFVLLGGLSKKESEEFNPGITIGKKKGMNIEIQNDKIDISNETVSLISEVIADTQNLLDLLSSISTLAAPLTAANVAHAAATATGNVIAIEAAKAVLDQAVVTAVTGITSAASAGVPSVTASKLKLEQIKL